MDRIASFKIFTRVAELQSFSRTAEEMDLPKATVSNAIQQLEALLGTRLLHRTTRRVNLTAEGQAFYERCLDLLNDLDETESMFRGDASAIKGSVRVDMTVALARNLVIPRLPEFLVRYPEVQIELSSTDRRVDLIREGVDCVVRSSKGHEPGLISKDLGQMPLVNCASPGYLAQFGIPQTLADLSAHRLVYYAQQLGTRPEGFEYFDGQRYREIKMNGILTVNNTIAYESAALAGLGIVQAPRVGILHHLQSGHLVEILPDYPAEALPIKLVYPYRRRLVKRLKVFMDWLELILEDYLDSRDEPLSGDLP